MNRIATKKRKRCPKGMHRAKKGKRKGACVR